MLGEPQDDRPTTVLSVAPHFGAGRVPFAGHEETYQLGLSQAANAAGIDWTILAPRTAAVVADRVVPCLDHSGPAGIAQSVEQHLRTLEPSQDVTVGVVVYEADTALAVEFVPVAERNPSVRFLVNLFRAEPGLDVPLVRRKRSGTQREVRAAAPRFVLPELQRLARVRWPANLLLSAESEAKGLLARSSGMPVQGTWRLHSALAALETSKADLSTRDGGDPLRILIALRSSQLHGPLVDEVVEVIERVGRFMPAGAIDWVMAGRFDTDGRVDRALDRLTRAGVSLERASRPLEPDAYMRMFLGVDAVWMPTVWPYRIQSSGKALDALVAGRPVIAPAGTAPAAAMQRWVPGAPAYGSVPEAAQVFLRLPSLVGLLRSELDACSVAIRTTHHPRATVDWVVELLHSAGSPSPPLVVGDLGSPRTLRGDLPPRGSVRRRARTLGRLARALPRALRVASGVVADQR